MLVGSLVVKMVGTYWIRLAAWTSISSILYEFNSSLMDCARAGVNRLQVAGSLRRSYTNFGNVSHNDNAFENAGDFAGVVAERCVNDGAFAIVDSAGADEFGWMKIADVRSPPPPVGDGETMWSGCSLWVASPIAIVESKERGGNVGAAAFVGVEWCDECEPCR